MQKTAVMKNETKSKVPVAGKTRCSQCNEPQPPQNIHNGMCWGCWAIVEIGHAIGLSEYQRREKYTTQEGDPLGGHATRHPRTGLVHLDVHPDRITDYGMKLFGDERRPWEEEE